MKTLTTILSLIISQLSYGQDSNYSFKLLRLKDAPGISYKIKYKEFHKAISFRDSTTTKFQTNKRTDDLIVPFGYPYYAWEGWAHYNPVKDSIELWKTHAQQQLMIGYSAFLDLNGDKKLDIIFSNIYDQFLKTQSNWTDIYFNLNRKYKAISVIGYLISMTKKKSNLIFIKTVEQPVSKLDTMFKLHNFQLDTKKMTITEIAVRNIHRKNVRQSE